MASWVARPFGDLSQVDREPVRFLVVEIADDPGAIPVVLQVLGLNGYLNRLRAEGGDAVAAAVPDAWIDDPVLALVSRLRAERLTRGIGIRIEDVSLPSWR